MSTRLRPVLAGDARVRDDLIAMLRNSPARTAVNCQKQVGTLRHAALPSWVITDYRLSQNTALSLVKYS